MMRFLKAMVLLVVLGVCGACIGGFVGFWGFALWVEMAEPSNEDGRVYYVYLMVQFFSIFAGGAIGVVVSSLFGNEPPARS